MTEGKPLSLGRSLSLIVALAIVVGSLASAPASSAAQGHQGLQGGWAVDDSGHVNFLHSSRVELPLMQQAGAGVLRLNFRLGACFSTWSAPGCATADAPTAMAAYDQVVNSAINTYHLQVVGLLSNEELEWRAVAVDTEQRRKRGWHRRQRVHSGVRNECRRAAGAAFRGRISTWEVWNEPNAWTSSNGAGVYSGGSFIYPSNFAWLLKRSYAAIKTYQKGKTSTVISGGLFGHDPSGAAMLVSGPSAPRVVVKHGTTGALTGASVWPGDVHQCRAQRSGLPVQHLQDGPVQGRLAGWQLSAGSHRAAPLR